jgi:hypothetical protein
MHPTVSNVNYELISPVSPPNKAECFNIERNEESLCFVNTIAVMMDVITDAKENP